MDDELREHCCRQVGQYSLRSEHRPPQKSYYQSLAAGFTVAFKTSRRWEQAVRGWFCIAKYVLWDLDLVKYCDYLSQRIKQYSASGLDCYDKLCWRGRLAFTFNQSRSGGSTESWLRGDFWRIGESLMMVLMEGNGMDLRCSWWDGGNFGSGNERKERKVALTSRQSGPKKSAKTWDWADTSAQCRRHTTGQLDNMVRISWL